MNIKCLDKDFNVLGELDNFYSLVWHRKYFDIGTFKLVCRPQDILADTKYLYRADAQETGRVDRIESQRNSDMEQLFTVSGRFLEGLLDDRIIYPTFYSYKTTWTSYVIADLIRKNIISPADGKRKVDRASMNPVAPQTHKTAALQASYDNLADYVYSLCLDAGQSIRAVYDFDANKIIFSVWEGKNRTQEQTANTPAIFSDAFDNLNSVDYYRDIEKYKNFVYIAGEDSGSSRRFQTINNVVSGEDRKELFVDARDIQSKDEDQNTIPDAQYNNMLIQRGKEKLAEWGKIETADCEIATNTHTLIYKEDYDLGDICTIRYDALGVMIDKRITECIETFEEGAFSLSVTFGEDVLNFWKIAVHK